MKNLFKFLELHVCWKTLKESESFNVVVGVFYNYMQYYEAMKRQIYTFSNNNSIKENDVGILINKTIAEIRQYSFINLMIKFLISF